MIRYDALEVLLFLEKHGEADDCTVNQQSANNRHNHGWGRDKIRVREQDGQRYENTNSSALSFAQKDVVTVRQSEKRTNAHHHEETGAEPTQVKHGGARALDEVVWVRAVAAYPVGNGRKNVGGDDKEWVVRVPECARQDDEQEPHGQHEGEGNYRLEACCWHCGW